ncbi:MAG: hypothetical protein LBK77_03750 [Spirochaetaceae bacterium]|jgi:hypothetical protein|nr:hypothetical protein [Spirochaetaceae bacterium]
MKFFICSLEGILLGIPAGDTERIIPAPRVQENFFETDKDGGYISLPALFKKSFPAPHGMILKTGDPSRRLVLLVPRIDTDLDVPGDRIRGMPAVLAGVFPCFREACFLGEDMILLLQTGKLAEAVPQGAPHD